MERPRTMTKTRHCNCKSGCQNRRCACLKNGEPCDENCGCTNCSNPLNGVDVEKLSVCAIQHIVTVKALSDKDLAATYQLPCEHEKVAIEKLLNDYSCTECQEIYWFSFCWGEVEQDSHTWHCEICGQCREWREWHCEDCNRCTYGISLPCEWCGDQHDMSEWF